MPRAEEGRSDEYQQSWRKQSQPEQDTTSDCLLTEFKRSMKYIALDMLCPHLAYEQQYVRHNLKRDTKQKGV